MNDFEAASVAPPALREHAPHDSASRARVLPRWRAAWTDARPSALCAAFLWITFGMVDHSGLGMALGLSVCGLVHGVGVHALMRLFAVRRWALPLAGLLCGPVPLAWIAAMGPKLPDRGGVLFFAALIGLAIGVLDAARQPDSAR